MKYITGNTTKFKWTHDHSVWIISNHTLVLEGRRGLAVLLLDDGGRKVLAETLRALPSYYTEPVTIKLDDTTSLALEPHESFIVLSVGEVKAFMEVVTGHVETLINILEGRPAKLPAHPQHPAPPVSYT